MATATIRGYCAQCAAYCPTIAHVRDGVFAKFAPDRERPNPNRLMTERACKP